MSAHLGISEVVKHDHDQILSAAQTMLAAAHNDQHPAQVMSRHYAAFARALARCTNGKAKVVYPALAGGDVTPNVDQNAAIRDLLKRFVGLKNNGSGHDDGGTGSDSDEAVMREHKAEAIAIIGQIQVQLAALAETEEEVQLPILERSLDASKSEELAQRYKNAS